MKKIGLILIVVIAGIAVITGCAGTEVVDTCVVGKEYGFFNGIWHGLVAVISFIGSLFFNEIAIYAVNNNGPWYDLGFILGFGGLGFGSGLLK